MIINYDQLTSEWFDRAMSTGPVNPNWKPDHYLDLFREWPEKYVKDFKQPFNPFIFAVNCTAIATSTSTHGITKAIAEQIAYLELVANFYTEQIENQFYVRNDFSYAIYWANMKKPFYGAFMNAYTAYGFIRLFEATHDSKFLDKAEKLISTMVSAEAKIRLSSTDQKGDFWLNEYVFTPTPSEVDHLKKIGTEQDDTGFMRFRIYNGNIGAIMALMKFRKTSGLTLVDEAIEKSCMTMSRILKNQLFANKYFAYSVEAEIMPDYGQPRAVKLAKHLAEATGDESLIHTHQEFEKFYDENIKDSLKEVYAQGNLDATLAYKSPKPSDATT